MARHRRFLDKLTPEARELVEQIGGDPDFLNFLLAWHQILRMPAAETHQRPLTPWPYWSTSRQRQVKRKLKERHGLTWKEQWKDLQALAKAYEPPRLGVGWFGMESEGPKPPHGPFQWKFWLAVCDVKTYFTCLTKRPHWNVIAAVFFRPRPFNFAESEWSKRQERLSGLDHERSLDLALSFYDGFKPVILEVLERGVPITTSPHREHFERLWAEGGFAIPGLFKAFTRNS